MMVNFDYRGGGEGNIVFEGKSRRKVTSYKSKRGEDFGTQVDARRHVAKEMEEK